VLPKGDVVPTYPLALLTGKMVFIGMYLRHSVIHKDGKKHTYWRLVRSVRIGKKVRQETVAQLGELDARGRLRARALATQIGGHEEQPGLFDQPLEKETAEVRLNGIRMERTRRFGDVWLGQKLWRMAKLDKFFESILPIGEEDIAWSKMAELTTIARFCEPSSELHIEEDWLRKTALADMLGIKEEKVNDDRLYRTLDKILPWKAALERHLKGMWEGLFKIEYDLLLYDITSTYFEGEMKRNPEARRGHSRDHRPDCKQLCIGLIVTREGMPLGYEVFPGNTGDSTTVRRMVKTIEDRYGKANRVWVMDRGMVSEETLEWMREGKRFYVVGTPKSELKKHRTVLEEKEGWKNLGNGVRVRYTTIEATDNADIYLICQSEDRQKKENSMRRLFERRIESSLQKLQKRLERSKKPIALSQVERQVGRLLERNQRSGRLFKIRFDNTDNYPSGIRLYWEKDLQEETWRQISEGCYVLRSNKRDWKEEDVWMTYIQLTDVEAAFRIQKSDLGIRPVWHHKPCRARAHILVCFLAYILWKMMEQWQKRAGLGNSPRTILEELKHIQSGDVILPTLQGEQIRIRCIARPEKPQRIILQRLGIDLPRRMRIPIMELIEKM
jgi:transposase